MSDWLHQFVKRPCRVATTAEDAPASESKRHSENGDERRLRAPSSRAAIC
jgi:hypothetical protein